MAQFDCSRNANMALQGWYKLMQPKAPKVVRKTKLTAEEKRQASIMAGFAKINQIIAKG